MPPSGSFKTDEKAGKRQTKQSNDAVRTDLCPQHRKMKTYSINSTEMIAMPFLCFAASLVAAGGFWVMQMYFEVESDSKVKDKLFWLSIGLFVVAVLVQVGYFVYYFVVRSESKQVVKSGD
jgi:hypothetical protein